MKKFLILTYVFFVLSFNFVFAQNSGKSANRNTALRCLKLAENCLVGNDWDNALRQADLGLSYDENISDLIYVKAVAESNLGKIKADVLTLVRDAFEKNDWVGYSKNGARIVLADLLCDTGLYEESLSVLDSDPLLYSADAEFIRVKNYYRLGTAQTINNARLKLNSIRRIYPGDYRFPELFFMFETLYLNETVKQGMDYEIPEIVKIIAASYIAKLPDYSGLYPQMELMATYFADDTVQNRLIRAIDAKNQTNHPLLALAGLKCGLYSEEQAVNLFFNSYDGNISLNMLEYLVTMIKSSEIQQVLIEKLQDYTGEILIDENYDLQNEILVKYEAGRPVAITYDKNNDGVADLYSTCDLGAPVFVHYYENKSEVFYDGYPKVNKVIFIDDNYIFNFIHDDFTYTPFSLNKNEIFEKIGIDFYVPQFNGEIYIPTIETVAKKSSKVELPITERNDARIVYTIDNNELMFADFYENETKYATCDFTTGFPYIRYIDYDNDNYYETSEVYDKIPDIAGYDLDKEKKVIQSVFSKLLDSDSVYLKKVLIDRNGNTIHEFSEEYIEGNGKITLWDNDDNGIWDCQYIRYPQKDGNSVVEETIYYDKAGIQELLINTIDGIPIKMTYKNAEVMIYAGSLPDYYWIDMEGTTEQENFIANVLKKGITQGAVDIIQCDDVRISVVKVNQNVYCRLLPESEVIEETEDIE